MENRISISIGVSDAQIAYVEQALTGIANGVSKALSTAVNEALRSSRADLVRRVAEHLLAKKHQIRDPIYISEGAHLGKTGWHYEGVLTVKFRSIPIYDFNETRFLKKSGVTTKQLATEPAQTFRYMFAQTMQSGHKGIFQREVDKPKRPPSKGTYASRTIKRGPRKGQLIRRQPIKETFGASVVSSLEVSPEVSEAAQQDMAENLTKAIDRKVKWILDTAGK